MIAEDMIAVGLTPPFKAIMVAAPSYLEARGEPRSIVDLQHHNCIGFRLPTTGGIYAGDLTGENGSDVSARVRGTVLVTDPLDTVDLAVAGVGIAYVFEPLVRADIRDRRLRWLLPAARIEEPGLSSTSLGTRRKCLSSAFIDSARGVLKTGEK